jgi:predicted DNA-binding protein
MNTAFSLPDETAEQAARLARRLGLTPAELCTRAVCEYLDRHDDQAITEALNAVIEGKENDGDAFVRRAAKNLAVHVDW